MSAQASRHPASFRDPESYVVRFNGLVHRVITDDYLPVYNQLKQSGLYDELVEAGLLLEHSASKNHRLKDAFDDAKLILTPKQISFISYPYEWSYTELKDAALTTLEIQRRALSRGFVLKDASAFNIQFIDGRPMLIDLGSFAIYKEGEPWVAYRQFCQHFLAPLSLAAYRDTALLALSRNFIDGIPLNLAAGLLPKKTALRPRMLTHLMLHAKAQSRYQNSARSPRLAAKRRSLSQKHLTALVLDLAKAVKQLRWRPGETEWGEYYKNTNYSDKSARAKQKAVQECLESAKPTTTWDLGANDGRYSRLAAKYGAVIAWDIDPVAVDANYRHVKQTGPSAMLPLILDLTNPSPALGWAHQERMSLIQRGPADVVMALALIHHLAISHNVPFEKIAEFMAACGQKLIIEFVPKDDSKVQLLLSSRRDIFTTYTQPHFETAFKKYFRIIKKIPVKNSRRTLYYMQNYTKTKRVPSGKSQSKSKKSTA